MLRWPIILRDANFPATVELAVAHKQQSIAWHKF